MKKGSAAMMDKRQTNQGEGVRTTSLPQAEEEKLWVSQWDTRSGEGIPELDVWVVTEPRLWPWKLAAKGTW